MSFLDITREKYFTWVQSIMHCYATNLLAFQRYFQETPFGGTLILYTGKHTFDNQLGNFNLVNKTIWNFISAMFLVIFHKVLRPHTMERLQIPYSIYRLVRIALSINCMLRECEFDFCLDWVLLTLMECQKMKNHLQTAQATIICLRMEGRWWDFLRKSMDNDKIWNILLIN